MRYVVTVTFRTPAGAIDLRREVVHADDIQTAERLAVKRIERQPGREVIGTEVEREE